MLTNIKTLMILHPCITGPSLAGALNGSSQQRLPRQALPSPSVSVFSISVVLRLCVCAESLQSCLTLCDPMNHSLPGSSVHGIPRQEYWSGSAMLSFRGPSQPRDQTLVSCGSYITGRFFTTEPLGKPILMVVFEGKSNSFKTTEHSSLLQLFFDWKVELLNHLSPSTSCAYSLP